MRPFTILSLILIFALLAACAPSEQPAAQDSGLTAELVVTGGDLSKTYSRPDLENLTVSQAVINDVTYQGVLVSSLLEDAGFDLTAIKALKAVASDGFTVNYDPSQVLGDDILVAYATADGDLVEDDGSFRMVLPGEEGKLNVRMLVGLQVVQ